MGLLTDNPDGQVNIKDIERAINRALVDYPSAYAYVNRDGEEDKINLTVDGVHLEGDTVVANMETFVFTSHVSFDVVTTVRGTDEDTENDRVQEAIEDVIRSIEFEVELVDEIEDVHVEDSNVVTLLSDRIE